MGKKAQAKNADLFGMPKAPWIFVVDPSIDGRYGMQLSALIPEGHCLFSCPSKYPSIKTPLVIVHKATSQDKDVAQVRIVRGKAIEHGANFASVNIMNEAGESEKTDNWGTNHLDIVTGPTTAEAIFKWLCESIC